MLYAIENGGFSGGIMPQNVVVGQDADDVAQFVATYAGRQSPKVPGTQVCSQKAIGNNAAALQNKAFVFDADLCGSENVACDPEARASWTSAGGGRIRLPTERT